MWFRIFFLMNTDYVFQTMRHICFWHFSKCVKATKLLCKKKYYSISVFQLHRKHELSLRRSSRETALHSGADDALETWIPESLHVSTHQALPWRLMGRGNHSVPTTAARQTKQLVPCVAWHDSFWQARDLTAKWVISVSQQRVLSEAPGTWYASLQKTFREQPWSWRFSNGSSAFSNKHISAMTSLKGVVM